MKRYEVELSYYDVTKKRAYVLVEAESEDEALEKAEDFENPKWEEVLTDERYPKIEAVEATGFTEEVKD